MCVPYGARQAHLQRMVYLHPSNSYCMHDNMYPGTQDSSQLGNELFNVYTPRGPQKTFFEEPKAKSPHPAVAT